MTLRKIIAYTVYISPDKQSYRLDLRLEGKDREEKTIMIPSLPELNALVDLLRNEGNTLYNMEDGTIVIGWEMAGERQKTFFN